MRKFFSLLFLIIIAVSCKNPLQKNGTKTAQNSDTALDFSPVDTMALTLEALRNKRLPNGYEMVGDVKTEILTYTGFRMNDTKLYVFKNEAGNEVLFSGNDTQFQLTVKSQNPTEENGGFDPNPRYLNKKFQTFWRRIQLVHNPMSETELYYQEYDEIIFLKMMPMEIVPKKSSTQNNKTGAKKK